MKNYIVKQKALYTAYAVLLVASSVTSVFFAFVLSEIFNCAEAKNLERLCIVLFGGTLFLVISVLLEYLYGVVKNKLLYNAREQLKNDLFEKILQKSVLRFEEKNLGEYMNELQNNLNIYEELYFKNILQIPSLLFSFVIAVMVSVYISPVILFVILVIGVLISFMVKKLGKRLEKTTASYAEQSAVYLSELKDNLQGHRTICAYGLWEKVAEKHHTANVKMEAAKKANDNAKTLFMCLNELAGLLSTILIMGIAALFAIRGDFGIGIVMAFGQLSGKIISPIMTASDTLVQFQSSKALTEGYRAILFESEAAETREKKQIKSGDIELHNVIFSLGNHRILNNFSESFQQGKKYLVIGESGSGKSTLLHIIAGLYQAESGSIKIGGASLQEADAISISRQVTLVRQEVFLFHASIRDNITLFEDYSEEKIQSVIKQCGLETLIHELPDGLDTIVSENGVNFSGGERQRMNLARAFLRDTSILLLDEVTANLDRETTEFIENEILSLEGKTVVSVSHKISDELQQGYDKIIQM